MKRGRNFNTEHDEHGRFGARSGGASPESGGHTTASRVPAGVGRELGLDDPTVIAELKTSGIHVTSRGVGDYITAGSRERAQGFVRELEHRASSEWDSTPAVRAGFKKYAIRLRSEWGI